MTQEGVFKDGVLQEGEIKRPDGFSCKVKSLKTEGDKAVGQVTWNDGETMEGEAAEWSADGMFVKAKKEDSKTKGLFEGEWRDGHFSRGKLIGDDWYYEGDFDENSLPKKGKSVTPQGQVFEGDFENGLPLKGKQTEKDGSWFEGEWKDGELWKGKKFVKNPEDGKEGQGGETYEGEWKDLEFWMGKKELANGEIVDGEWRKGKLWKGTHTLPDGTVKKFEDGRFLN